MKKNKKSNQEKSDSNLALMPLKGRDIAVAGLIWQPIHALRNIQAEAKSLIHNEQCQYFLTYTQGSRAQCGMTRNLPQAKRCWSAIMLLRESLGESWLGLFRLPDNRFWLAAVDNGLVVPGGDSVFEDESQARERYRDYLDLFAWQRKYIDGLDDIEGESIELVPLLQRTELKSRYRIVFAQKVMRQIRLIAARGAIIVAVLSVLIGGWQYYQHKQEEERLERLRAEQLARMRASGFAEKAWRTKLPALVVINGCFNEMSQYPVDIAGWNITDIECDGKLIKAKYKAGKNATSKNFEKAMHGRPFNFQKGMTAEITEKMTLKGDRKKEKLQPVTQLATNILEIFQLGLVKGKMDDVLSNHKKTARFEIESQLSPLSVFKNDNFDGVVIHSVKGRISSQNVLTWYISGEVYGK